MQYKKEVLYKEIQRQYPDMDRDFIKKYFLFIMEKIKQWSANPDNLILNVKGLGRFYWRKREVENDFRVKSQYTDESFKNSLDHQNFVNTARFIMEEYEKYDAQKVKVRKANYKEAYKDPEQLKKERLEFLNIKLEKNVNTRKD